MPCTQPPHAGCAEFNHGIAPGNALLAMRAAAAKYQEAQYGDVVKPTQGCLAMRAMGGGMTEVVAVMRRFVQHHARQAMNHYVGKAAHEQAEQGHVPRSHTTCPISNIGKYKAMTKPPTKTPSTTMMAGSTSLDR